MNTKNIVVLLLIGMAIAGCYTTGKAGTVPETADEQTADEETGYGCESDSDCLQTRKCCDNECIDPQYDASHCKECDNECPKGELCQGGHCDPPCELLPYNPPPTIYPPPSTCAAGLWCCSDGQCADLLHDENNCGSCGTSCKEGQACYPGWESYETMPLDPGAAECIESDCDPPCEGYGGIFICCDRRCVEFIYNKNCGGCGVTCEYGEVCAPTSQGGPWGCVPRRGCCMFENRCEMRDDPYFCQLEDGYKNHWFGRDCSSIAACEPKPYGGTDAQTA